MIINPYVRLAALDRAMAEKQDTQSLSSALKAAERIAVWAVTGEDNKSNVNP